VNLMEPIVSLKHLSKTFGATHALQDVDLELFPGEIHALVGQNGSGKSTVVKILSGFYEPEAGEMYVAGQPVSLPLSADRVSQLDFAFVHQDLGLADSLSVVDNIRIRSHLTGALWRIRWDEERELVRRSLREFDVDIDPDRSVGSLSVAERTIVAIVRALHSRRSKDPPVLLATDEPTSYLPADERNKLFAALRRLTVKSVAVLFITHRLDEVDAIADRVSVLRDGRLVGSWLTRDVDPGRVLRAIVGKNLGDLYPSGETGARPEVVLEVRGLTRPPVADLSFALHRGEIVGLTGLLGMGHGDVPYLVYGSMQPTSGDVIVDGQAYSSRSPSSSLRLGMALLPGDRRREGAILGISITENATLATLRSYFVRGRISRVRQRKNVAALLREFRVVPPLPDAMMSSLSGGNQQKVIFGKWLSLPKVRVLMLHEPTQGVDIGSRQMLFEYVRLAADRGIAVLYVSAEYEDLAHLCDRVLVMRSGRLAAELAGPDVTYERIVEQCYVGGGSAVA
jgi:ribose transport system ATP-binding protein